MTLSRIVTKNLSVFKTYFSKRFPLLPLLLYTTLTAGAIQYYFQKFDAAHILGSSFMYLCFLLHLRILDECKDEQYDKNNHPDRPVQKGDISLRILRYIGLGNIVVIILLAFYISKIPELFLLLFSLFYSFLMFKEFFIGELLRKHIVFYLVSHQVVFIPLFFFFYSVFNKHIWLPKTMSSLLHIIVIVIPIVLIEIGRKMVHRYHDGKKTNDTYAYVWGEENSLRVFSLILFIAGIFSFGITHFSFFASLSILFLASVLFTGSFLFPKSILRNYMVITTASALYLPLSFLLH
jgi:4-hydroxybenzoate polyprenyltransferase